MNTDEHERLQRFETLRAELSTMDDEALKARFWELCHQVMEPVVELSRTHTSPSIERSVLLRMGINSVTTHAVVENVLNAGLLGKGAGHVVLRLAQRDGISIRDAGDAIAEDPAVLAGLFEEKKQ
ncbi:ornithine aminomutase [Arachnia propionica]|uniref:Ornithine aminomutase n=1 Tax=Arachnia propionica TaxID=1750 RepID=A0A3P1T970_9ACTN|nr:ornithine aminomutase subunit alpha [Arachnia propionica]MDO5082741.1 ornithine aminomutase subunit alpha [Arachnia propionica]RRD05992.1 ornithine aminomutase [Arachnia propionica]